LLLIGFWIRWRRCIRIRIFTCHFRSVTIL
jgi:hypothetical protein